LALAASAAIGDADIKRVWGVREEQGSPAVNRMAIRRKLAVNRRVCGDCGTYSPQVCGE
jgi:hypothetical protein